MSSANARNISKDKHSLHSEAQNKSKDSKRKECLKSRIFPEPDYSDLDYSDLRPPYLHDRDRILYSRAFRRLASKTQIVTASGRITSDHIRNRLTHSLEVMQIGSSIALEVNGTRNSTNEINLDLIQAIALGHDIGHTAFGHVGEQALGNFLFYNPSNNLGQNEKRKKKFNGLDKGFHHAFQSLKVCCFLEKAYKPDFWGLNLTIATLDGIFKHTHLNDDELKFYRGVFDSYREEFWKENKYFDSFADKKLTKCLFDYVSPVTCEGIIVSIADEIAQLCHDVEDIRRLGGFEAVSEFYEVVKNKISDYDLKNKISEYDLLKNAEIVRKRFEESLNEVNEVKNNANSNTLKLERLYVKLIINLCIPIVSKMIKNLCTMDKEPQMKLLKKHYLGEFCELEKAGSKLKLDSRDIDLIKSLDIIDKKYKKTLKTLPEVARWDIKGKELCEDLANTLYKALDHKNNNANGINLDIFNHESREDLNKSYEAGKKFVKEYPSPIDGIKDFPIKFVVLDHLVGMTDSFIIKEYESLTFKRVELR